MFALGSNGYYPKEEVKAELNKAEVKVQQVPVAKPSSEPVPQKQPVAPKPTVVRKPTPQPTAIALSKQEIMTAAGISPNDWAAVDYIISHESGWRYTAVNKSSGATGLCQALPASKMASAGGDYLTNPVTQMKWCSSYAQGRYVGWWGAYNFWQSHRWW